LKIKNILVSQPKPENDKSPYWDLAKRYNLVIDFYKFIRIEGVSASDFRKDKVKILDHTAIILTSKNAVDHFFRISKEMRAVIPETMKYFCISESTALYLQKYIQYRKRKIFHSRENVKELIELIKKHREEKFLLPCSDVHKQDIPKLLSSNKINYTKAIIYRTLCSDLTSIDINKYDMLVMFSPSGITSLFKNFPKYKQGNKIIAAFGSATAKAVKKAGLKLNIEAPKPKTPSMTSAIEYFLANDCKENL
jgi:uroporphyrinogen-III synthase